MFTKSILAIGALAVAANAVPFKRDVVYVTEYAKVIETVAVTHTVWIDAEPTTTTTTRRHRHGHGGQRSSAQETTVVAAETTAEATSTSTTPVYVAPTPSSVVEVAPASTPEAESTTSSTTSSTSVYVAPTTTSTTEAYVAPTTTSTTEAYVAPTTTSTTEAYVAPVTTEEPSTTSATPTLTLEQAAVETSAVTSDNSASSHTGDLTWYTPGLGSCGWTSTESDAIVALPHGIMTPENGANPNNNPLCGRTITVNYNGATHQAKVVDTCGGCAIDDIDVSPSLFQAIAPNGDGRVHGVSWSLN